MIRTILLASLSILVLVTTLPVTAAPRAIRPERCSAATPANGIAVECNPPSLLWPVEDESDQYLVRMSQSSDFPKGKTLASEPLRWAMFNPHAKLEPGTWYWQYDTLKDGKAAEASDVFSFELPADAREFVTPPARALVEACAGMRPRVLLLERDLDAFRARAPQMPEASQYLESAKRLVGQSLPGEQAGKPKEKGADAFEDKNFAKWASKSLATNMADDVRVLCKAYLISGDARFGEAAKERGLHIASWDPDGVTAPNVSDFADGACLDALALAYDTCHALLSADERKAMVYAIEARAGRMFEKWRNNLETQVFSAHIWQHMLAQFTHAAFATLGDLPDAEQWAAYAYEIWIARFPLMGGEDGGWGNGSGYFRSNLDTISEMPSFFGELTGVNFFGHPWYRNVPYYMMYVWPPDSASAGFGDGAENQTGSPDSSFLAFADAMSRATGNADGAWYVQQIGDGDEDAVSRASSLAWHRLRYYGKSEPVAPTTSFGLPQARAFRDIGLAMLNTDLADAENNLMVAFRSSPYGSTNHGHASQNEFNLLFGGVPVFHNSGYYIAYGDDHFNGWYKHTRGHNAMLIDGKGQKFGTTEGYGWIPRFLNGDTVAYCVGDASHAYPEDAGLKKWRRHVALLRPSILAVYDEFEADHAADWDWLLHSGHAIRQEGDAMTFATETKEASARVSLFGSTALEAQISTEFDPPADNWRGKKDSNGKPYKYPDQWHLTVSPKGKTASLRLLAVIEVAKSPAALHNPDIEKGGTIQVGTWRIQPEFDPSQSAGLRVLSPSHAALAVDGDATTLIDTVGGTATIQRATDEWPAAARQAALSR